MKNSPFSIYVQGDYSNISKLYFNYIIHNSLSKKDASMKF